MSGSVISALLLSAWLGATPAAIEGDAQNIVFLAVDHPVFVCLHVQVEGKAFRTLQPELARRLFDAFDADKDGVWTADEQKSAADSGRLTILGNDAAFDPKALDGNTNGRLDRDEFVAHAVPALGAPILVRADPQSPARSLPLFEKLDEDEDGRLSERELERAWHALRKLDLDDDELLSLTEMLPPEIPGAAPAMATSRVESPVVVITSDAVPGIVRTLLRRYSPPGKSRIGIKSLGLPEARVKPFDANGDGFLAEGEIEKLLRDPPPHREILVQLPRGKRGRVALRLLDSGSDSRPASSLKLQVGGFSAEVRGASTLSAVADNRNFYRIQFRRADADKNQYLSESEFGSVGLEATFAQVDRDGDTMVTEQEVLDHLSLDDQLNESRIELLVSNDGKSLFELMDADLDQRISPREFLEAARRLMQRDQSGDKRLDSAELDSRVRVSVSLDRPKLFQPTAMMPRPAMTGRPRRPVIDAPDWFLKMDRNRDGDVSSREFLGPLEVFERMDADRNGVLDPDEASAAK